MDYKAKSVTPKEIILNIQEWLKYLLKRWYLLLIFIVVGACVGYFYAKSSPRFYVGETNLVFKTSPETTAPSLGLPQLVGPSSSGDLFQGLNLLWLYKSKGMMRRTLLSKDTTDNQLLIRKFIAVDAEMQKRIEKSGQMKAANVFPPDFDSQYVSPIEERYLNTALAIINEDYFRAKLQENTNGVINLKFSHTDEKFVKAFLDNLVASVNTYYIENTTSRLKEQIQILEEKIESAEYTMVSDIYESAEAIEEVPYPNPNLQTIKVSPQKKAVESDVSSRLYVQLVQQLEQAKLALAKETPVLQIIDQPRFPLTVDKKEPIVYTLIGSVALGLLAAFVLTLMKIYKDILN